MKKCDCKGNQEFLNPNRGSPVAIYSPRAYIYVRIKSVLNKGSWVDYKNWKYYIKETRILEIEFQLPSLLTTYPCFHYIDTSITDESESFSVTNWMLYEV